MGPSFTSFADILLAGLSGRPCADAMTALTTEPVGDGVAEDGWYGGDGRGGVGNGYLQGGDMRLESGLRDQGRASHVLEGTVLVLEWSTNKRHVFRVGI